MPTFETKEQCQDEVGHLPWPYVDFEKVENRGKKLKVKKRFNKATEQVEEIIQRYPEKTRYFRLFLTDANGSAYAWCKENLDQVRKYMRRFKVVGYGNFERYRNCDDMAFAARIRELESELGAPMQMLDMESENAKLKAELTKLKKGAVKNGQG